MLENRPEDALDLLVLTVPASPTLAGTDIYTIGENVSVGGCLCAILSTGTKRNIHLGH